MMELSIIPITENNKFIIFKPRTGLAFVGNRAMANLAQNLANGSIDSTTIDKKIDTFLGTVGFYESEMLHPAPLDQEFLPTTAVLLMTNQCQLRCTYCYAAAGELPAQDLRFETAQVAIDHVCENAMKRGLAQFEVAFHGGGEPTFAWHVLKRCVSYARQKPISVRISLTSNGIWTAKQREWIIENLDTVGISMDGMPETQNRQRPFSSGQGSAEYVLHTLHGLDEHQLPYGIRLTATAPWHHLKQDIQFICEHTQCPSMQVEPAFNTKRGGHSWPDKDEMLGFATAFLEASDVAESAGRFLMYSGARLGMVTDSFCTAPYNALIVNSSGYLVTCYEIATDAHALAQISTIGRIREGQVEVNNTARNNLHSLMAERKTTCEGCFAYWSCAGDCYARAFNLEPDGHLFHSNRCEMNRYILRELLLRRIANTGVWRNQNGHVAPHVDGSGL